MHKNAYAWLSSRDSMEEKEREGERWRVAHQVTWSRKRTSAVWQYFGFRPNEKGEAVNTDEAICKLCNKSNRERWKYLEPKVAYTKPPSTHCCEDGPEFTQCNSFNASRCRTNIIEVHRQYTADDNGGLRENNEVQKGQCPLENLYWCSDKILGEGNGLFPHSGKKVL